MREPRRKVSRGDRRPLAAVLAAKTVSVTGDALTGMAVPWFVLRTTGSAAKAGVVACATLLPLVVAAALGGPIVDRWGRRRVAVSADVLCGAAVAAIPLLRAAGALTFPLLCGLMALTGLVRAPGRTARDVALPALAARAAVPLGRAASWYDGAARSAGMVGSACGGVLIAVLGTGPALAVDAGSFAVSAALVALGLRGMDDRPGAPGPPHDAPLLSARAYRLQLADGFRCLAGQRLLLALCLMTLATRGLDEGWSAVLLPLQARDRLGGTAELGVLETLFGAGALIGALAYGAFGHRFRRRPLYTAAFLIVGAPRFVVAACTGTTAPLAAIMAVEGLACGVLNPIVATVMFETVPEELRSRVLGATTAAFLTAAPLGGLGAGLLAGSVGLPAALLGTGAVYFAATLSPLVFPAWQLLDGPSPPGKPEVAPAGSA